MRGVGVHDFCWSSGIWGGGVLLGGHMAVHGRHEGSVSSKYSSDHGLGEGDVVGGGGAPFSQLTLLPLSMLRQRWPYLVTFPPNTASVTCVTLLQTLYPARVLSTCYNFLHLVVLCVLFFGGPSLLSTLLTFSLDSPPSPHLCIVRLSRPHRPCTQRVCCQRATTCYTWWCCACCSLEGPGCGPTNARGC